MATESSRGGTDESRGDGHLCTSAFAVMNNVDNNRFCFTYKLVIITKQLVLINYVINSAERMP